MVETSADQVRQVVEGVSRDGVRLHLWSFSGDAVAGGVVYLLTAAPTIRFCARRTWTATVRRSLVMEPPPEIHLLMTSSISRWVMEFGSAEIGDELSISC